MLTGVIRPVESRTMDVEGQSLAEIQEKLDAAIPAGWALVSAPVAMVKGSSLMNATGTFQRIDGLREIEADSMPTLQEKVPEGWMLLSVR